jgi:hypothetical protein
MCGEKMMQAYVTSTLPITYFINEKFVSPTQINCTGIVYESYKVAGIDKFPNLSLRLIPGGFFRHLFFLLRTLSKAKKIIIFHECSWVILDLMLVFLRPNVLYQPMVTLKTYRLLNRFDVNFFSWYSYYKNLNLISRLGKSICKMMILNWFDHMECTQDGGLAPLRVSVLKTVCKADWECKPAYLANNYNERNIGFSKNIVGELRSGCSVLILCGTEPVPNLSQITVYDQLVDSLAKKGFNISFKDHPNPESRLHYQSTEAKEIDPIIPSQILDGMYDYVIGAFSTSLVMVRGSLGTISVGKLLNMPEEIFSERLRHLYALHGYESVKFMASFSEIDTYFINQYLDSGTSSC